MIRIQSNLNDRQFAPKTAQQLFKRVDKTNG